MWTTLYPAVSKAEALVQFSSSIMSDSLRPQGLHDASLPCPSPTPRAFVSIKLVMPSNLLILCRSLHLLPSIFPNIRVFSNELVLCIRCPKYWSFSFSISPSNEYSGLISFRIDWLDLLAVQGILKSLLQSYPYCIFILLMPFHARSLHSENQSAKD